MSLDAITEEYKKLSKEERYKFIEQVIKNPSRWQKLRNILKIPKGRTTFDLDLINGYLTEKKLERILNYLRSQKRLINFLEGKIEVKDDYLVSETGNIAVEISYKGNPSGLNISEAETWAYVLGGEQYRNEIVILIKKSRLQKIASICRVVSGGDVQSSEIALVQVQKLLLKDSQLFPDSRKK